MPVIHIAVYIIERDRRWPEILNGGTLIQWNAANDADSLLVRSIACVVVRRGCALSPGPLSYGHLPVPRNGIPTLASTYQNAGCQNMLWLLQSFQKLLISSIEVKARSCIVQH